MQQVRRSAVMTEYAQLHASNRRALDRIDAHRADAILEAAGGFELLGLSVTQLRAALRRGRWEVFLYEQRAIAQAGLLDKVAEVERRLFGDPWDRP
jgi:hypothetical protein